MTILHTLKKNASGDRLVLGIVTDGGPLVWLSVDESTYLRAGSPVRGEEIDAQTLALLTDVSERHRAVRYALYLLSYGGNSERKLAEKLRTKGFSKELSEYAAKEMVTRGYLREEAQIESLVLSFANDRLYGPRRILAFLTAKGYAGADVRRVTNRLMEDGQIDVIDNFKKLALKKKTDLSDPTQRQKLKYTYGY